MTDYDFPALTDQAARYWLTMDTWNPYDAVWLLCGVDPQVIRRRDGEFAPALATTMCRGHPESEAAYKIVELLKASEAAGRISFPASPRDVIAWAKAKELDMPKQFLDVQPDVTGQATGGTSGEASANRKEARIAAIVKTARQLGYDPLSVPHGGKAAIQRECLDKFAADPCRFTSDTFKSAWQAARDAQQIDVQNAEIYRGQ